MKTSSSIRPSWLQQILWLYWNSWAHYSFERRECRANLCQFTSAHLKICKCYRRLHKDSRSFRLSKRFRQGDTSSPKLFIACLEWAFRNLDRSTKGILIGEEYISHLRIDGDIVIFTSRVEGLQIMFIELNEKIKEVDLHMNQKKSKSYIENSDW